MHLKNVIWTSAMTVAVGLSALTAGVGVAIAQPGSPPCGPQSGWCEGPGGPGRPSRPDGPPGLGDRGRPGGPGAPGEGPRGPDGRGGPGGRQWGPPPPDFAWRGIDQVRYDHQPFNYNGNWVEPVFNPDFNGWGFWFLGIWIPL